MVSELIVNKMVGAIHESPAQIVIVFGRFVNRPYNTLIVFHINNNLLLNFTLHRKAPSDEGAVSKRSEDD